MDNTPGDKLGVWRDTRLADALVLLFIIIIIIIIKERFNVAFSK